MEIQYIQVGQHVQGRSASLLMHVGGGRMEKAILNMDAQRATLLQLGIVAVGGPVVDMLPPMTVNIPDRKAPLLLERHTKDTDVLKAYWVYVHSRSEAAAGTPAEWKHGKRIRITAT